LGLDYLVATDWDDFVSKAVALNEQRDELGKVRRMLRDMMRVSAFGDHGAYTRAVESKYRKLWQQWATGQTLEARLKVVH
jgi:predicted O-linked N-acetylglucosamine transferase (SPINDLY family)